MLIASLVVAFTASSLIATSHAAGNAYVRVNQVGYITSETKQAILMATGSESEATFSIVNTSSGQSVYTAPIGASQGSWSGSFPNTYLLDFTPVQAAGSYTIRVSGPINARSPSFSIDTGANLYSGLLPNAWFFYQAQRDGANVNPHVMNRQPSHLKDKRASIYANPHL